MNESEDVREAALSPADADAVGIVVAQLALAELPLGEGLLAAAREVGSRRVARALKILGHSIQRGATLAEALRSCSGLVPPAMGAALAAAENSRSLGPVLAEWTENHLASRARSRQLQQALAYPVVCVVLATLVLSLIGWHLIPAFDQLYREFELRIPGQTVAVLWLGRFALPLAGGALAAVAVLLLLVRVAGGRIGWCWCARRVPLLGKLWHWSGVAEALRILAILIEQRSPLPEALMLAGNSAADALVARSLLETAGRVQSGASLSDCVENGRGLPRSLAPLLRSAERSGTLAGGLRGGAVMLERRVASQCELVATIVPPLLFLSIGFVILVVIGGLVGPLLQLIEGLSK